VPAAQGKPAQLQLNAPQARTAPPQPEKKG
jgi:hypothetical protein